MAYEKDPRLVYERKIINFRLPMFLIERLNKEKNKTKIVEQAIMKFLKVEYPGNER